MKGLLLFFLFFFLLSLQSCTSTSSSSSSRPVSAYQFYSPLWYKTMSGDYNRHLNMNRF